MDNIQKIFLLLHKNGVTTDARIDVEDNVYLDLNTGAKSRLYLYEDGTLKGRYNYKNKVDLTLSEGDILRDLCYEFVNCLHGRDYFNHDWKKLCEKQNIKLF